MICLKVAVTHVAMVTILENEALHCSIAYAINGDLYTIKLNLIKQSQFHFVITS